MKAARKKGKKAKGGWRSTVSINGQLYDQLEAECHRRGLSVSSVVTRLVESIDSLDPLTLDIAGVVRIDQGVFDDRRSATVDIAAVVSPRVRDLLSLHAARIRRHQYRTGQTLMGSDEGELLEAIINGTLDLMSLKAAAATPGPAVIVAGSAARSPCAICVSDKGPFHWEPIGKDDAMVSVCEACEATTVARESPLPGYDCGDGTFVPGFKRGAISR